MKTTTPNLGRTAAVLGLLLPVAFIAGCGGGGSGPTVKPTPTPAPTPTPTPSPAIGTYQGTYNLSASGIFSATNGTLIIRVQTDGTAVGVLNEGALDVYRSDASIPTTGTVNLSTGQISLSGTFDASEQIGSAPIPTTVTVSGTANSAGASGTLVETNSDRTQNGTFTTTKTSTSSTAVPTPTPVALKKATSGLKKGRL